MRSRRNLITATGLAAAAFLFGPAALAAFPDRPIRIVVPFGAGGPVDLTARLLATRMTELLGQQVVVDNRPGASTMLGAAVVARSEKDGYTLLLSGSSLVTVPLLYKKVPFKVDEFIPVSMLGKFPFVLMVRPSLGVKSVKEYADLARTRNLNYAHTGPGSPAQLVGELVNSQLGIAVQGIPYKGGTAQSLPDLLGDRLDASIDALQQAAPNHVAGKVQILATTGTERSALVPDVPTFAEAGFPGITLYFWTGLFVPVGTPQAIVDRLNDATRKALANEDLRKRMVAAGQEPYPTSPAEVSVQMARDTALFLPIVKRLGVQLDE